MKKRSYILVSVLVIMAIMLIITYFLADALFSELAIARNQKGATIAFHLAEAGAQEAIWRVKNHPTAKDNFKLANGLTEFSHPPDALITGGFYEVKIQNTAPYIATVTSIGYYQMGLRTARREIKINIAKAELPPPYNDDGAFFSHSAGGESTGDLEFSSATVNVYGGSIHSGRDISFKASTVNAETGVKAEGNVQLKQGSVVNCNCFIETGSPLCSSNPGCAPTIIPAMDMPMIDFEAYKLVAMNSNPSQYYTSSADFFTKTNFSAGTTKTMDGIVYVEGGLDIDQDRILNMNGVLASSGSISVGGSSSGSPFNGVINLNRITGDPDGAAGILAMSGFTINTKGNLTGTGLIYTGFRIDFNNSTQPVNFTGGFLSRRLYFNARTLNIHFDGDVINDTLGDPTATPVIQVNHWEEEY